jgi:hypothetical protein
MKMATKKTESKKEEALFSKEQILASNKYANTRDVCTTVIPDDFNGTLNEVDILIEKFMKGKVN